MSNILPSISDYPDLYKNGFVSIPQMVSKKQCEKVLLEYENSIKKNMDNRIFENKFNSVEHREYNSSLIDLSRSGEVLKYAQKIYGDEIGIFHRRMVIKDQAEQPEVRIHQDTGYHIGFSNKTSFFICLTEANEDNGGMFFIPKTHRFGYLGDAGEIDGNLIKDLNLEEPVCVEMKQGDAIIMSSYLWHFSNKYISGCHRIMTDIIYQSGDDISSIEKIKNGKALPQIQNKFNNRALNGEYDSKDLFSNSRVKKIRELNKRLKNNK